MNSSHATRISKFLSLVLRHEPSAAGVTLDEAGWVSVEALLKGCEQAGRPLTLPELEFVVSTNAKKRFEFSADGTRIRASQGHSVKVDLRYEPLEPPTRLYHGTVQRFLDAIRADGLLRMERTHVHLSGDMKTATEVGARRGKPVVLTIRAGAMHAAGHRFYLSTNGVWLVDHVPTEYIEFL